MIKMKTGRSLKRKAAPRAEKPKFEPNVLGRALQSLIETGDWNLTDVGRDGKWAQLSCVREDSGRRRRIRIELLAGEGPDELR